jgi:hypothetical protein
MLVPAAHSLQLLVQDQILERQLRKSCQDFVKRSVSTRPDIISESLQQIYIELPITDLSALIGLSVGSLQPVLLTHLCLGYLKLADFDPKIKN